MIEHARQLIAGVSLRPLLVAALALLPSAHLQAEATNISPEWALVDGFLLQKSVQDELQLDAAQVKKLPDLRKEYLSDEQALRDRSLEGEQEQKARVELDSRFNRKLGEILGRGQRQRLRQIYLQDLGLAAWLYPDVQKQLGLKQEQVALITKQVQAASKVIEAAVERAIAEGKSGPTRAQLHGMAAEQAREIDRILTNDQRVAWRVMLGQPSPLKR
jgi:hypothetical protein